MAVRYKRYFPQCRGITCNGRRSKQCPNTPRKANGVYNRCGAWCIEYFDKQGQWRSLTFKDVTNKTEAEKRLALLVSEREQDKLNSKVGALMKINGHKYIAEDFKEYIEPERLKDLAIKGFVPCLIHESGYPVFKKQEVVDWIEKNIYVYSKGKQMKPVVKIYPHEDRPCIDDIPEEISGISELKECSFQIIPSCVYFLCDGTKILYIGQSKNLYPRLSQHIEDGKRFNRVLYFYVQPNELDSVEIKLIKALKPPLNIQGK